MFAETTIIIIVVTLLISYLVIRDRGIVFLSLLLATTSTFLFFSPIISLASPPLNAWLANDNILLYYASLLTTTALFSSILYYILSIRQPITTKLHTPILFTNITHDTAPLYAFKQVIDATKSLNEENNNSPQYDTPLVILLTNVIITTIFAIILNILFTYNLIIEFTSTNVLIVIMAGMMAFGYISAIFDPWQPGNDNDDDIAPNLQFFDNPQQM